VIYMLNRYDTGEVQVRSYEAPEMVIRLAREDEWEKVFEFYYLMIDDMQYVEFHPAWEKDVTSSNCGSITTCPSSSMYPHSPSLRIAANP